MAKTHVTRRIQLAGFEKMGGMEVSEGVLTGENGGEWKFGGRLFSNRGCFETRGICFGRGRGIDRGDFVTLGYGHTAAIYK